MQLLIRLFLWNAGFVLGIAVLAISVGPGISDAIGLALPCLLGFWLLFLGALHATRRGSVIAIAVAATLLILLQCAIWGFGILLSRYNTSMATQLQLGVAAIAIAGATVVWWFLHAKLSKPATGK